MRTLKICIIAVSLFMFTASASAATYPPEIPDLEKAPTQFVCETKTSWFLKLYLDKNRRAFIAGYDKKEMMITKITAESINVFVLIPSSGIWKNTHDLTTKEDEEFEKFFGLEITDEDNQTLQSCIVSNLRTRGFRQ